MNVRAKFKCIGVRAADPIYGPAVTVTFSAVTNDTPENKTWSKLTPSGTLSMYITNENLLDHFEVNKEYYLDIIPA